MKYNHIILAFLAFLTSLSLLASAAEQFDGRWPFRGTTRRGIIPGLGKGGKGGKGHDKSPLLPTIPGSSGGGNLGVGEGRVIGGVSDAPKTTIESWGLTRSSKPYDTGLDNPQYMNSITGRPSGNGIVWQKFEIKGPDGRPVNTYLTSPADDAYVTKFVQTNNIPGQPRTMMAARDMMADNYVKSGGDLATLKYIGTDDIVEASTVPAVEAAFVAIGRNFKAPSDKVVFTPGGPGWNEFSNNALVQGQLKMLEERAGPMGNARIERYHVEIDNFIWNKEKTFISMVAVLIR